MKIGIIGAGFFGLHLAHQLKSKYPKARIDIFEMQDEALMGASTNNQCRLHLGFHYPRSGYTIYQSVMGSHYYLEHYEDCTEDIQNNYYAIHKKGFVNAMEYMAVMDSFSLEYTIEDKVNSYFKNHNEIELILRVPEKVINPKKIKNKLLSFKQVNIYTGIEVDAIDAESGKLFSKNKMLGEYDYLINATYMNPNMGLSSKNKFELKYELTMLLLGKTNLPPSTALTIMDGPFASIYPAHDRLHTLSSVLYTPFKNFSDVNECYQGYKNIHKLAKETEAEKKILEHINDLFNIDFSLTELWLSSKTKLSNDKGDSRVTDIRREGKLFSVMCGKLDAVLFATDGILGGIND